MHPVLPAHQVRRSRRHLDTCTALTSVHQSAAHHCCVLYPMSSGRDDSGHCGQPLIRPQMSSAAGCRPMQLCQLPLSHVWSIGPAWQPLLSKYITAHIHYWSLTDQAFFCSGYVLPSRQSLHGFTTKSVTITHRTVLNVLNIYEMRGKKISQLQVQWGVQEKPAHGFSTTYYLAWKFRKAL